MSTPTPAQSEVRPWVSQMTEQALEYQAEDGREPRRVCECDKPAVCIGQFEGETGPKFGCDACCVHVDYGACGRCWALDESGGEAPR